MSATEFECTGRVYHQATFVTNEGRDGAAQSFKDLYGAWPDAVGESTVVGGCESCLLLIFDDQKYHSDSEGVQWHCAPHCCECEPAPPAEAAA